MICGKYINISLFLLLITGWWLTDPSEKYESQWKGLSHILWEKCLKPPIRITINH